MRLGIIPGRTFETKSELITSMCLLKHTFLSKKLNGADPATSIQAMFDNLVRIKKAICSFATLIIEKDTAYFDEIMDNFALLDSIYRPFLSVWHGKLKGDIEEFNKTFPQAHTSFVVTNQEAIQELALNCAVYAGRNCKR